jgi:hypothetical protein
MGDRFVLFIVAPMVGQARDLCQALEGDNEDNKDNGLS